MKLAERLAKKCGFQSWNGVLWKPDRNFVDAVNEVLEEAARIADNPYHTRKHIASVIRALKSRP